MKYAFFYSIHVCVLGSAIYFTLWFFGDFRFSLFSFAMALVLAAAILGVFDAWASQRASMVRFVLDQSSITFALLASAASAAAFSGTFLAILGIGWLVRLDGAVALTICLIAASLLGLEASRLVMRCWQRRLRTSA